MCWNQKTSTTVTELTHHQFPKNPPTPQLKLVTPLISWPFQQVQRESA
ncbi:MAG: hypothetical protein K0U68_12910 [Gammaproteobacteria bacterium]|nr:hypothetical protein [Gammaproteobacteria bacterium]